MASSPSPTETLNPNTPPPPAMDGPDSSISSIPLLSQSPTTTTTPQSEDLPIIEPDNNRKRSQPEPESDKSKHPLWKTSLCSYFRRTGGLCSHGESCRYAHGEDELRQRPDKTWDPTSERAKKLLKGENGERVEKSSSKTESNDEVLMTEAIGDESNSDPVLQKCLVNLPMKWSSDNLRTFLTDQVNQ